MIHILCVLRDLCGGLKFFGIEVFELFFLLASYRVISVFSVCSVVKGEKCGEIS
jgi:hypothetical protein